MADKKELTEELGEELTTEEFNELKEYKQLFDKAWEKLINKQAYKKSKRVRLERIGKPVIHITRLDYFGFSKEKLKFINFLLLEKLKGCTPEEKPILLQLNKEVTEKISSKPVCPHCGSFDVSQGWKWKRKGKIMVKFKCRNCGAVFAYGMQNTDWKTMIRIIKLYFEGFSGRQIEAELVHRHGTYVWFNIILSSLKELKPYLRPRYVTVSKYHNWIKNCKKCRNPLKKIIMSFNYCPDCDTEITKGHSSLHKKIMESNLYSKKKKED